MEPRIQYAKTTDGVSIAFWTLGEGMPFVHMPSTQYNPTLRAWQTPEGRRWCERLAETRKFVRYDNRGFGHSQRYATDFSLEALVLDLEAVVDRVAPEKVALFGYYQSGPVAIAYAARHPERVSHLILWCTSARGVDFYGMDTYQTLSELAEKDWEFFTESWAQLTFGWSASERARQYAAFLRESATPKTLRAVFDATFKIDVADLLPQVRTPTLVVQRHGLKSPCMDVAHGLAARIPDARLAVLEGELVIPYADDMDETIATIDEFLGEGEEAAAPAEPPEAGAFRTVLFTDVEASTALTDRLGDAKARELLREHERLVREALKSHGGSEVKTMGDGFMASFSSATKALECAVAMQRAFAEHNEGAEEPIRVRVGLNAGEPIAEEDPDGRSDLFGTAVNEAARIAAAAQGGEILVSNVVRELTKGKDFQFADRGNVALKGFDEPVRLYELRWREEG
jgi:class 3 adenylate cyclase